MQYSRRDFLKQAAALSIATPATLLTLSCQFRATPTSLLLEHDGVGLAELIRTRQITPIELVEEVLRQIEALNPSINAVVQSLFDPEIARARAVQPLGQGPLAGVPVMLKNLIEYSGAKIDFGSRLYARAYEKGTAPLPESASLANAIEGAGMIVTGITNSAEFGLLDTTETVLHGGTRNPWNPEYSVGGSSGGAGAVVAARIVPLAHGNDGGGSIRIPAAHCGVFGLKPSRGRVGSASPTAMLSISTELCLSRSVRDTAAFLSIVENQGRANIPAVGFVAGPSTKRLKIALVTDSLLGVAPHREVEQGVRSASVLCEDMGHTVEETKLPVDGPEFIDAFIGLWAMTTLELEDMVVEWLGSGTEPADVLEPWTLGLLALVKERGRDACILRAMQAFAEASTRMEMLFADYDVVLSPVLRVPPYRFGDHDPTIDFDVLMDRVLDAVGYTPLHNATGMTGMSVPLHWTTDGLPVGVQYSAWRGQEKVLLELAYELEEARSWSERIPPIAAS